MKDEDLNAKQADKNKKKKKPKVRDRKQRKNKFFKKFLSGIPTEEMHFLLFHTD